jgi:hypothetical protein
VNRDELNISVLAPHAVAVMNGVNITAKPPRTEIWALLYAQVIQADGKSHRNILLDEKMLIYFSAKEYNKYEQYFHTNADGQVYSVNTWSNKEVDQILAIMGLPISSSLSVLCVEMMPRPERYIEMPLEFAEALAKETPLQKIVAKPFLAKFMNMQTDNVMIKAEMSATQNRESPLGRGLGQYRILRTSPLTPVPFVCCI